MKVRIWLAAGTAVALLGLGACSSGSSGDDKSSKGVTLTYWATNQGANIDDDKRILQPELDKFTQQTGIHINLQIVPWSDLINNQLAAGVSGQGPDVSNLGNTNATTLATTGAWYPFDDAAMEKIGGKDKFVESAFATAGPSGKTPQSLPLYSQVYALYYNKKLFADAGLKPPTTWEEMVTAAKALTKPDHSQWGITMPAGTVNVSMHLAFITTSQNGGSPFNDAGKPDFTNDAMVKGIKRYVDLMGADGVMNPSNAQYTDGGGPSTTDFATGKAAMYFQQTGGTNGLRQNGMNPDAYGIVPIPAPQGGDSTGDSFVAGTNIAIFKKTKHRDEALQFVKFMTSAEEQQIINGKYGTLPVVKGVPATAFSDYPDKLKTWTDILANNARPLSLVPAVSAYQANVGAAVVKLMQKAATGKPPTEADVRAALTEAQQKMASAK
jgi:multiple sugar transport system substrate-binding protein